MSVIPASSKEKNQVTARSSIRKKNLKPPVKMSIEELESLKKLSVKAPEKPAKFQDCNKFTALVNSIIRSNNRLKQKSESEFGMQEDQRPGTQNSLKGKNMYSTAKKILNMGKGKKVLKIPSISVNEQYQNSVTNVNSLPKVPDNLSNRSIGLSAIDLKQELADKMQNLKDFVYQNTQKKRSER